jgi:hypothetical protein
LWGSRRGRPLRRKREVGTKFACWRFWNELAVVVFFPGREREIQSAVLTDGRSRQHTLTSDWPLRLSADHWGYAHSWYSKSILKGIVMRTRGTPNPS